ncbi:alpha/beta fold hydrolase [Rhodococcus globerulus]|uniref:Alpha/beta hydrolase n=1 Tax=Rhodococcus globerulus TaxID=33008 RepID=A0ABU4C4D0_RHOGO|nr:alpha/beta hydrolase [Rhodococcus globerulus]MDV6271337.1 alpha/beta hydrolase [Rhodococcus globerulus]
MDTSSSVTKDPVTLVFTHGFGDSGSSWDGQLAALSAKYPVKVWDLPGHGDRHQELPEGYDIASTTAELDSIVAATVGPVVLVGHSVGGYISLRCALTMSTASVVGLVLISAGPGFRSAAKIVEWNSKMDRLTTALAMPSSTSQVAYMSDSLVAERISSIVCPTLVVRGRVDHEMYLRGSGHIAENVLGAELLDVADAGHNLHRSHPREVNTAIDNFVTRIIDTRRIRPQLDDST